MDPLRRQDSAGSAPLVIRRGHHGVNPAMMAHASTLAASWPLSPTWPASLRRHASRRATLMAVPSPDSARLNAAVLAVAAPPGPPPFPPLFRPFAPRGKGYLVRLG